MRNSQTLQVYPSGFIGAVLPTQPGVGSIQMNVIPNAIFGYKVMAPDLTSQGSVAVDSFNEQLIANPKFLKDPQVRETIMKEAFKLFQFKSFAQWIQIQSTSPFYSSLHRDFLEQTMIAVLTGQRRRVSIANWLTLFSKPQNVQPLEQKLLSHTRSSVHAPVGQSGYTGQVIVQNLEFSKTSQDLLKGPMLGNIVDVMVSWFSTLGFEDFVQTLYLVFGDNTKYDPVR